MILEKYTFTCHFTSPALLPEFKGSTLRGGFGHALKKISCALRYQKCNSCLLFATCAYSFLFETGENNQRPHPYVIIPSFDKRRSYKKGDVLTFDIILFGRANDYLPHIIYAVREMGKEGLGKNHHDCGRLTIDTVAQGKTIIFVDNQLEQCAPPQHLQLLPPLPIAANRLTINCQTPLRLKFSNELRDSLPFHILIRAALRRISSLEEAYGEGEPELDYRGLAARASKIKIASSQCHWQEIERYSNRQRQAMKFGGIIGRISYESSEFAEFLPLINYCQQTHIGKQTSFGLGKITVESSENP